jgi:hypothetical protein
VLATNALAQSAREVRDASPYVAIENEPPPKLTVDPTPLAAGLAHDIVWIQYHAENVRIVPVFGTGALNVSPRIGHLHVHIDDLPWGWVEATGDNNTISVAAVSQYQSEPVRCGLRLSTSASRAAPIRNGFAAARPATTSRYRSRANRAAAIPKRGSSSPSSWALSELRYAPSCRRQS